MTRAPFAFIEEEMKTDLRDAMVAIEVALCLIPEAFDAVDMIPFVCESLRVVDAHVVEIPDIMDIAGAATVVWSAP